MAYVRLLTFFDSNAVLRELQSELLILSTKHTLSQQKLIILRLYHSVTHRLPNGISLMYQTLTKYNHNNLKLIVFYVITKCFML